MFCNKYEILISRNLDEDLSKTEKQKLSIHLSKCSECRKKASHYFELKNILKKSADNSIKYNIDLVKNKNKISFLSAGLAAAAVFIIAFIIGFQFFNQVKEKTAYQNNIVNYPLGSIVYYEKKSSDSYEANYLTPMSSYYTMENNSK